MSLNTRKLCVRASFSRFVVPRVATRELVCDLIVSVVAFERDTILFQKLVKCSNRTYIYFMCVYVREIFYDIHIHTSLQLFVRATSSLKHCARELAAIISQCAFSTLRKNYDVMIQLFK